MPVKRWWRLLHETVKPALWLSSVLIASSRINRGAIIADLRQICQCGRAVTLTDRMHAALIERTIGGRVVGVIARDAIEIEAREKPVDKGKEDKDDPSPPPASAEPQKKRGRPARTRNDQNRSRRVSNGKRRRTSLGCTPISPPPAMSAPRETARATRRRGSPTSCISMSPAAKSRFHAR